jgi:hypothetical protein
MKLAQRIKFASALALVVVGSCSSPKPATLNADPQPVPVPRWQREPTLAYLRTEVIPSLAPGLEPDRFEDILELRNATQVAFLFGTMLEDGLLGSIEPAASNERGRNSVGGCGNAMRSRTLAPGESFVMRAPCRDLGRSRAWITVWDAATKEQITLVSDEYDSAANAPAVRPTDRE